MRQCWNPVFEILVQFLAIEPLEEQPAGVAEVEERLALLVNQVASVGADLQSEVPDRTRRRVVRRGSAAGSREQERRCEHRAGAETDEKNGRLHDAEATLIRERRNHDVTGGSRAVSTPRPEPLTGRAEFDAAGANDEASFR